MTRRARVVRRPLWAMWWTALGLSATPLAAQTDPRLVGAVELAEQGQGDSARAVTARILAATPPTDPRYAEVLYTASRVASTMNDRRLYLQRVAVEYARSDWADDALLQLAQISFAEGDHDTTVRHVSRLLSDYPRTPLRASAALWGARAAMERREPALACQWADLGLQAAGESIELLSQLEFQRERCRTMMVANVAPPPPPPGQPAARAAGTWFVQVAALRTRPATTGTVRGIERLGYPSAVVEDGGFFKVRAGPFRTREEAAAALARLRQEFSGQPFVLEVR